MLQKNKKNIIVIVGNYWPYIFGGTRIYRIVPELCNLNYEIHVFTMPFNENIEIKEIKNLYVHQVPYSGDIFEFLRKILNYLGLRSTNNSGLKDVIKSSINVGIWSKFINKAFNIYQAIFGFPDTEKYWLKDLNLHLENFLKKHEENIYFILSEYPVISHICVSKLKKKYNFFWIADFVDLWSQNHNYQMGLIRKKIDQYYEKKVLNNSDLLVTTCKSWEKTLKDLHGYDKSTFSMQHGFDSRTYKQNKRENNVFNFVYAGRLYTEMQDTKDLLQAWHNFYQKYNNLNSKMVLEFYGDQDTELKKTIMNKFPFSGIKIRNKVSKEEIMKIQKNAACLVLIGIKSSKSFTDVPSKIFEYMWANRPVLVINVNKSDELNEIVRKTGIGEVANSRVDIFNFIEKNFKYYCQDQSFNYKRIEKEIIKFSNKILTKDLLNKIREIYPK